MSHHYHHGGPEEDDQRRRCDDDLPTVQAGTPVGSMNAEEAHSIVYGSSSRPGWRNLEPFPSELRGEALAKLADRDAPGFLRLAGNHLGVSIVFSNVLTLRELGILEGAFIPAVTMNRMNNASNYTTIRMTIPYLDRDLTLAAGDPLPGSDPWTIYRGVSGNGRARRVKGYSWTRDYERAVWFAERFEALFPDPAVFKTTVARKDVLFYSSSREEEEFFVDLPSDHPVKRVARLSQSPSPESE